MLSWVELIVYAAIGLLMGVFSGIAGGGAGFIMTPLLIALGLSPAQAVATGKFNGLAATLGSIGRLHREKLHSWRFVIPIMLLATVIGVLASIVIVNLDSELYKKSLGILILIMAPLVLLNKLGQEQKLHSKKRRGVGYVFLSLALSLQAVFSTGMGSLVNVVLMSFFGQTSLEASITKRLSQVLLNTTIIIGVFGSGLIVLQVVVVGSIVSLIGGLIGSTIAIKKGNVFVSYILVTLMFGAGLYLLIS